MTKSQYYLLLGFVLTIAGDTGPKGVIALVTQAFAAVCFIITLGCCIVGHYEKDKHD